MSRQKPHPLTDANRSINRIKVIIIIKPVLKTKVVRQQSHTIRTLRGRENRRYNMIILFAIRLSLRPNGPNLNELLFNIIIIIFFFYTHIIIILY